MLSPGIFKCGSRSAWAPHHRVHQSRPSSSSPKRDDSCPQQESCQLERLELATEDNNHSNQKASHLQGAGECPGSFTERGLLPLLQPVSRLLPAAPMPPPRSRDPPHVLPQLRLCCRSPPTAWLLGASPQQEGRLGKKCKPENGCAASLLWTICSRHSRLWQCPPPPVPGVVRGYPPRG